jgi:hypothetical protein
MTGNASDSGRICDTPISTEALADYWMALSADADDTSIEEHLLGCDECGDRLRDVIGMVRSLQRLAHQGSLRMIVSDTFVSRARDSGLRVREYAVEPGTSVACTVSEDDDLLVSRLAVNVSHSARVDVSLCDAQGVERSRLRDIPVRADAETILVQESMTLAKALPTATLVLRLLSVDAGEDRLLGEYTFNHTRSLPGPGTDPHT